MIEIREKDTVTILNYIKDNDECLIGEMMEIDTGIKEERQREIIENLEIDYNMIELGREGWEITENTLDRFNKTGKWLALDKSDLNKIMSDMIIEGKIKPFEETKPERVK